MSETPPLPYAAHANQARASDPNASVWVSANAGTGKTEVLVRRSLRLLLAGSAPESILCLTYTKMAAAEMQNRLLKELAAWATIATEALRERLAGLIGAAPDAAQLRSARRLFAQTLEAKGGLKIYTIHGFCERLLQRFPLEAEVPPHFAVLDEVGAARLRGEAFDATMARAAEHRDGPLGLALAKIVPVTVEDYFRQMIDALLGKRAELDRMMAWHDGDPNWADAECASLKALFGLAADETEASLTEAQAAILGDDAIDAMLEALHDQAATADDQRLKQALTMAKASSGLARAEALKPAFLTATLELRAKPCSAALRKAVPGLCAVLDAAQARYGELQRKRAELVCAEASGALLLLADRVQAAYAYAKRMQGVLDYDDLIVKARTLLVEARAASWVLYKIDGGIDHILVDEAQDTNPEQWSIIQALAEEFFSGEGASPKLRTLFAVGDEKQSIYSFQGADPARFGITGRAFRAKAQAALKHWDEVPLNLSFRSTEPVLEAVDAVFAKRPAAEGLTWDATTIIEHHAFRQRQAGLVELWPVETETKPGGARAFEPWNEAAANAKAVDKLCQRMAAQIKEWLENGEELAAAGRNVRPGDILILVRRREPFTAPMIRALKRAGVPVAGADRMRLLQQLAVMDLVALADMLLLPEDDLALANVLKSPLFGLDDAALFDLAYPQRASLWTALKAKANDDPRFAQPAGQLTRWLSRVDFTPPYEFFLELLEETGADGRTMRQKMLTRLGPEAAEALDEFLDLALAYDLEAAPSLQGFVNQLRAADVEIKRDMEQERDEVRIMTVHGAKGLQAPIVFLPDTATLPRRQGASLHIVPRPDAPPEEVPHLIWPAGANALAPIETAKGVARQAELEEYHRLLYVAMTRARDRLYVCGWIGREQEEQASWYDLVRQGLGGLLTEAVGPDGATVLRLETLDAIRPPKQAASEAAIAVTALPDWARTPAPAERSRAALVPSRLTPHGADGEPIAAEQPPLGPNALAANARFARGRLVHTLLQYLPEVAAADRDRAARTFVAARGATLPDAMREEIVGETLAIVQHPGFADLFGPGSLSEVPIVARLGERDLSGQIDRLAVLEDHLLILDYKTNRPPPQTPESVAPGYIGQLAAYRLALSGLFPGRPLRAAIVWTDGPRLMEIPSTLLDDAERRILSTEPQP